MSMECPLLKAAPSTESMHSIAPAVPMKRTLIPHALFTVSCILSVRNFPKKKPAAPPAIIPITLINVPKPGMVILLCCLSDSAFFCCHTRVLL